MELGLRTRGNGQETGHRIGQTPDCRAVVKETIKKLLINAEAPIITCEQIGIGTERDPKSAVYRYKVVRNIGENKYLIACTTDPNLVDAVHPMLFEQSIIVSCTSEGAVMSASFKCESGFMQEVSLTKNSAVAAVQLLSDYLSHFRSSVSAEAFR